jgi:hypothetical protein
LLKIICQVVIVMLKGRFCTTADLVFMAFEGDVTELSQREIATPCNGFTTGTHANHQPDAVIN